MAGTMIAFSGKGGVGKTTLASMTIRELIRRGKGPVLAVDADPNATLALTLGVEPPDTLADLRDRMGEAAQEVSEIPKERLMDQWLNELLLEESGFDMISMGRPEGRKCYCYVNGLLRRYLSLLRSNYPCVVVDCEAGMEYLSRLVVDDIEAIVLVAEATPIGLTTVRRISELVDSLDLTVRRQVLAINKLGPPGSEGIELPALPDLPKVGTVIRVPYDADVIGRCVRGEPVDDTAGGPARKAIEELVSACLGLSAPAGGTTLQKESTA